MCVKCEFYYAKARGAWLYVYYSSRYYWGLVEKWALFFLGDGQLILREGDRQFFKNKYPGRQTPYNKHSGLGP